MQALSLHAAVAQQWATVHVYGGQTRADCCSTQSNAALEMGNPSLACSRLAVAAKLAPHDKRVIEKLDEAVRSWSCLSAALADSCRPQFDLLSAAQIAQLAVCIANQHANLPRR
jgi:hypothetical protein